MKAALGFYSLNQSCGYLLNWDHDDINYVRFFQCLWNCVSPWTRKNRSCCPLLFIFPDSAEIERRTVSTRCWWGLDCHARYILLLKNQGWLKTFRKLNYAVVLATQSIADMVNSTIRDAVFESCPTKILLANPDAKGSKIGEFYRDFLQLNDRQANLISRMTRKREYYITSPIQYDWYSQRNWLLIWPD